MFRRSTLKSFIFLWGLFIGIVLLGFSVNKFTADYKLNGLSSHIDKNVAKQAEIKEKTENAVTNEVVMNEQRAPATDKNLIKESAMQAIEAKIPIDAKPLKIEALVEASDVEE